MKLFLIGMFFLALPFQALLASENPYQDHPGIKKQAHDFVISNLKQTSNQYSVSVSDLDYRLKLNRCRAPLSITATRMPLVPGKNTLNIRCPTVATPWRVFTTVNIQLFDYALVAKKPLKRGLLIKAEDVDLQQIEVKNSHFSYLLDNERDLVINHVLKRNLNRGDLFKRLYLKKQTLINKGDRVTILVKSPGFQISMKGIALNAGGAGEKIKLKNIKTKKIIQGIVVNKQMVHIQP
ncbi:MAG: flagellar basal body P-ring formation protein FlgA [Cycloclasticus sp.]|nr:flagellar basal body P-ring formation protein FlgA [Cycloclasticus sp.]